MGLTFQEEPGKLAGRASLFGSRYSGQKWTQLYPRTTGTINTSHKQQPGQSTAAGHPALEGSRRASGTYHLLEWNRGAAESSRLPP